MSISRRQFLLLTPAVTAGFILPSYLKRAEAWLDKTARPLLIPQAGAKTNLYAIREVDGYELRLGAAELDPPELSWREFAETYTEYYNDMQRFKEEWLGLEEDEILGFDLDAPADLMAYIDIWSRNESPTAMAYEHLSMLDLGPELEGTGGFGEIHFIDGCCPGNDYLGVSVPDDLSLSLLQERLNQLNSGIRIGIT